MLPSKSIVFICLCGTAAVKTAQALVHHIRLSRIPVRILVNGTRGKTEVTRMIAAGLREAGFETYARTTGTHPERIMPDGRVVREHRKCPPRLDEIMGFIKTASCSGKKTDAVVVECMAINPFLQQVLARNILKNSITVITNVRPDHIDVMGPELAVYAEAICASLPENGKVFTTEKDCLDIILKKARTAGAEVIIPQSSDCDLSEEGFYFRENVALACSVCSSLGVDRETSLNGIRKMNPDEGAFRIFRFEYRGRSYYLANATAANDPVSTGILLEITAEQYPDKKIIGVFCSRTDRLWRKKTLGNLKENSRLSGFTELEGGLSGDILGRLTSGAGEGTMFFIFGNYVGSGELLLEEAEKCRAS